MTTIVVDEEPGTRLLPPAGFVPPARQLLAEGFDDETEFYVFEGRPCEVLPVADFASDWSRYPVREIHPFVPILDGQQIIETEFRRLVNAMHAIG